jgi:TPP-dependent pyruvate/acetoin dehydrogenase alpha subunit
MTIDGNDIEEVVLASREAVELARTGKGPTFLVLDTMRMCGHAEHDDAAYVPEEMLERWQALDPIDRHRGKMLDLGVLDRREIQEIVEDARAEVEDAVERALSAPDADPETVGDWVFFDPSDPRPTGQRELFPEVEAD